MKMKCPYCSYDLTTDKTILKCPSCNEIVICPSSIQKMPHNILKDIVKACDVTIFSDILRLQGILADLVHNKLIRKIILLAVEDNVHNKLTNTINSDSTIRIESLKYFFATQNFLYKEVADYVVDSFAYSLGIIESINYVDSSKINGWFTDNSDKKNFSIYEKIEPAKILDLFVKDSLVFENQPFFINWEATNFTRAYINDEEIPTTKNEYETKISGYKKFVLAVENEHYKDARIIEVQPIKTVQISDFKVSRTHIKSGEKIVLSWDVNDANRITLEFDNKELDVTKKNRLEVEPTNTTEFKLTAYAINDLHSISQTINIMVVKPVQILFFRTNKKEIVESDEILLTWQVNNTKKLLLLPMQQDVAKLNKIELLPKETTTYILQASNEVSMEEERVSVFVHPLPVMEKVKPPQLPTFDAPLPLLSFDISQSVIKQIQKAAWLDNLNSELPQMNVCVGAFKLNIEDLNFNVTPINFKEMPNNFK